eukprot:3133612-Rhodomonas_salina.4
MATGMDGENRGEGKAVSGERLTVQRGKTMTLMNPIWEEALSVPSRSHRFDTVMCAVCAHIQDWVRKA